MTRRWLAIALLGAVVALSAVPVILAPAAAAATGTTAGPTSVQHALDEAVAEAADSHDVTTYAAVIDRKTGKVVAQTANSETQVASESLVKTILAAYYLVEYNGTLPADMSTALHSMIVKSDDPTATAYWTNKAVPTIAARYGLTTIQLADPEPGHWGSTRVSALGLATFLYKMSKDPVVGPWLLEAMGDVSDSGSDGFDQDFGFNAIQGAASKQGWGSGADEWGELAGHPCIHSIGLTSRYAATVLQTAPPGTYRSMRSDATNTVKLILSAAPPADSAVSAPITTQVTQTGATNTLYPAKATDGATPGNPNSAIFTGWWDETLTF
ncbi:MAG: hypothetical protein ACR2P2_10230 [Nakamurella sp.]